MERGSGAVREHKVYKCAGVGVDWRYYSTIMIIDNTFSLLHSVLRAQVYYR